MTPGKPPQRAGNSDMRYAIQVETPNGPRFVGPVYRSKDVARSWVPFVRAAWHGCRTRVVSEKQARKLEGKA